MLDTIALSIADKAFHITKPECFSPHANTIRNPLYSNNGGFFKATYNPSNADKRLG